MDDSFKAHVLQQLENIRSAGTYKRERVISTPQNAHIRVGNAKPVLNMCANNYLGLSGHPEVIAAARDALDKWGYGLSSVRFICGTQELHKELELRLSEFLGTEDTILYGSCFDANGGLFETLLGAEDAVISGRRCLLELLLQLRHIIVTITKPLSFAESHAIDDAGMI